MSVQKKISAYILTVLLSAFSITDLYSCGGQTTYACGRDDMDSIADDFENNCCAGSSITIVNVCGGGINSMSNNSLNEDGPNSSCA